MEVRNTPDHIDHKYKITGELTNSIPMSIGIKYSNGSIITVEGSWMGR